MATLRLIFVCSGNICRSPMAAALATARAKEREIDVAVLSCGTLGLNGHSAASPGQVAMEEIGLDISHHYSQGVQPGMLEVADYIFVMAPRHEQHLLRFVPDLASKIVRTWEFAMEPLTQIDDPVGQDVAAFRVCRDLIDECLKRWFDSVTAVSD